MTIQSWLTRGLSPSWFSIILALVVALSLPLLQHLWMYRAKHTTTLPSFLIIGPSGAGKTSLLTLLERGTPTPTRTSQTPLTVECELPTSVTAASNKYRSTNDPSARILKKFLLIDTPGHGKLRHFALSSLVDPSHLKGIIFMVDAAVLSTDSVDGENSAQGLSEGAEFLHDILLTLQKRHTSSKTSKGPAEVPVLIASNKVDLFTALPTNLVKSMLETEISRLRGTKSRGLLDSGVGMDNDMEDRDVLGGAGEGAFEFGLMEEYNVPVEVIGGNVTGNDGADVEKWWQWIGDHL